MTICHDSFPTRFGEFSVAVDETGAVIATAFGPAGALRARLGCEAGPRDAARTRRARAQLEDYFAGRRRDFDLLLAPAGTPFQLRTWSALRLLPFGTTTTYGEMAVAIGRRGAARAVGRANATNPICVIVPCHRVIGADGSLTGFAFGEELKRRLLAHETAVLHAAA